MLETLSTLVLRSASNRKGSVTTSATKRQSLWNKVSYKRFTTVDDVSSGSTVCLKLAEEIVLQGGVGGVAYHGFESLERTNT